MTWEGEMGGQTGGLLGTSTLSPYIMQSSPWVSASYLGTESSPSYPCCNPAPCSLTWASRKKKSIRYLATWLNSLESRKNLLNTGFTLFQHSPCPACHFNTDPAHDTSLISNAAAATQETSPTKEKPPRGGLTCWLLK